MSEAQPSTTALTPESAQLLVEAFGFLSHEREDIRKTVVHHLAQQSRSDITLSLFLASATYGPRAVDALLLRLHVVERTLIADILTILINTAAEGACAEMLVQRKVVRKAMRLLSELEMSELNESFLRGLQELTLMLLNNLTASHVSAVADLLQKDDEDMRGFYVGKLQSLYTRLEAIKPQETREEVNDAEGSSAAPQEGRDLQKWILHIMLNLTRTLDGQELLLEDDEWRSSFTNCLAHSQNVAHRRLVAQCYGNCACSQRPLHALLLKGDIITTAVERLCNKEPEPEIQRRLAEVVACMIESEDGMARLESINAKKMLSAAVAVARQNAATSRNTRVEVIEEDKEAVAAAAEESALASSSSAVYLSQEVCNFLQNHVLPYLDDVVDAYLAPGCDNLD